MKTCFVIQRFDGDIYDRRYRETFAPAIEAGGAKAVRADEVLGTRPVVEKIEQGLRSADVAFAEISEDNANVFLELGYALSIGLPTVIVCDRGKRDRLPFDIAHRPVHFYSTNAQSDYEAIAREIAKAVGAALVEAATSKKKLPESANEDMNVDDVKSACLTSLLDQSLRAPYGSGLWQINNDVARQGISERMVALAIASLLDEGMIERHVNEGQDEEFLTFSISDRGQKHMLRSYSEVMKLEREKATKEAAGESKGWGPKAKTSAGSGYDDLDDDIPF